MTGEISTMILTVRDLECHRCLKKIKKAICKLQDRENIQKILYEEKKNTVTISGPFDPLRLKKKLCILACKVIIKIEIVKPEPEPKPEPKPEKKPKPKPADDNKGQLAYLPVLPVVFGGSTLPVCCYRPCYGWCNNSYRCYCCGYSMVCPPSLPAVTYEFSSDCEQAPYGCSVM